MVFVDLKHDANTFANVSDSTQLNRKLNQWIVDFRKEGFLLAGIDSVVIKNNIHGVYLHRGAIYHYVMMVQDSITNSELNMLNINLPNYKSVLTDYWTSQFNEWIHYAADHSFPFARVDISPLEIKSDSLVAYFRFRRGPEIVFRQTDQRQKKLLDERVLNRMIGIIPGEPYRQNLVEGIQDKLQRLTYVQTKSSPRVLFLGNEGIVWLYLEKARASKFDVLLGLNPESGVSGKKYQLTGEAGFEILNSLKSGERIFMKYENLIKNSPRLKLGFDFPYIKFMPFGLAADFHLYRFGEQYIDLSSQLVISYPWSILQHSGVSFSYLSSSVLNPDSLVLSRTYRLPSQLDYRYVAAGMKHEFNSLDYKINPSSGWLVNIDVKAGKKTFLPNPILASYESDFIHVKQQYDSLNQNKEQAVYYISASWYWQLKSRHILKFAGTTNGLLSAGKILDNELIRIGGYKTLRGFDEDFFKCLHVAIQTIEYRFLLDRNSFLNVFSDFAFLKQPIDQEFKWNWYEGFGIGIQFQTKIGAFSLQYAIGISKVESVNFGKGKIHFGYSTLF